MQNIIKIAIVAALCVAVVVKPEIQNRPAWMLWGNPEHIAFDEGAQEWVNSNPGIENWRKQTDDWALRLELTKPERVPVKKTLVFTVREGAMLHRYTVLCAGTCYALANRPTPSRRLLLVNSEQILNETKEGTSQYRVWPHLGLNVVGTVAEQEGWEVEIWDEYIVGPVPLEEKLGPGDILGLSLVVTGMDRGVGLARRAKAVGASYVIAGNDSAIFRANQAMSIYDKPIDAIFTGNSLSAIRAFFRQIGLTPIWELAIPGVQVTANGVARSNERSTLLAEQSARRAQETPEEVFLVPRLGLYPHWETLWANYRETFGHKHPNPATVKNAIALFAQGCTRTRGSDVCSYCTIADVANVRLPEKLYLAELAAAYDAFGIDTIYNVTDSAFEMHSLVKGLQEVGARWPAMIIYGRAQGIARNPRLLEEWRKVATDRLLINVGIDSGSDDMLLKGIVKSSVPGCGSRLEENRQAVRNLKAAGVHLHCSLIFGSPGESIETCEQSLEFLRWMIGELGSLLDVCETDLYWLNFGSPASKVFRNYAYAQYLAGLAGKHITAIEWAAEFARFADELVVPMHVEESWYRHFTRIDLETAQLYNERAAQIMAQHTGSIRGRAFKPTA